MLVYCIKSVQFSVCDLFQCSNVREVTQSVGAGINRRKRSGKGFQRKERKIHVYNLARQQRRHDCAFYLKAVNTELGKKCFMVLHRTTYRNK